MVTFSIKNAILRTNSWAKSQLKQAAVFFSNFLKIINMILNENTMLERIYNPITAMGFSAMFTFQLENTKR